MDSQLSISQKNTENTNLKKLKTAIFGLAFAIMFSSTLPVAATTPITVMGVPATNSGNGVITCLGYPGVVCMVIYSPQSNSGQINDENGMPIYMGPIWNLNTVYNEDGSSVTTFDTQAHGQ